MSTTAAPAAFIDALNELFTRAYYSAAGYVFESQPFGHDEDDDLLRALNEIRRQERQHARMLGQILESIDRVPEPGAFPYWYRDLNYLTVPYMGGFVVESLETDIGLYERALGLTPEAMGLARTMLDAIRAEKVVMLEELRPVADEAKVLEEKRYEAGRAEVKKARAKRLAEEKAKKEALRKGAAAVPSAVSSMPDPDEPGISNKEKAKRFVLRMRAMKKAGAGAAAPAAGPSFEEWAKSKGLLDPEEDGIANKEKGKRKVLWNRGKKQYEKELASGALGGGGAGAPSFEEWAKSQNLLDPNEDGIDNKEKGKRKVLWNRAKKKYEKELASGALGGGGGGGGAPSFEDWAKSEGLLDPNEDGIDNKEKGKRKVLWNRGKKKYEKELASGALGGGGGGAPSFEDWAKSQGLLDPDEDGIDNKERGKRKVLWNRGKKKYEAEIASGAAAGGGGGGAQTFEQYAAANGVLDPDEAGIDNKEKGKRKVLWNRAKKKWEAEQNG